MRAKVSADVNQRFMAQTATFTDTTPVAEVFADIGIRTHDGRKVRALDPTGKDQSLLQAIANPALGVSGITNRAIPCALAGTPWAKGKAGKALSARISRNFRLLRDHGIIRKMPNQRRYQLTNKGRRLTTLLNCLMAASTQQLLQMAS